MFLKINNIPYTEKPVALRKGKRKTVYTSDHFLSMLFVFIANSQIPCVNTVWDGVISVVIVPIIPRICLQILLGKK